MRRRLLAVGMLAVTIGAGLGIHSLVPASAWTDAAGDALYAVAVYLLVVVIAPGMRPPAVAVIAGGWCIAVELLQLTGVPGAIAEGLPLARLVLGAGFDPRDLAVYVVAAAVAAGLDALARRRTVPRDRPATAEFRTPRGL